MRTELVIRDVRRTESLETYLTSHLEGVVESLIPNRRDVVMRLKVEEDSHRTHLRRPHFECSVYLKVGNATPIRIKKQDAEFHICVERLGTALRESLRRSHQKSSPLHRSKRYALPEFKYDEDDNSISA